MTDKQLLIAVLMLGVMFTGRSHAEEVVCEYDENEEWPWLDERVCQAPVQFSGSLLNDGTAGSTHPDCSDQNSDADGDGWGWENNQSCRVVNSVYPKCLNPDSDPDRDGWGWENGKSCLQSYGKVPVYPDCDFIVSDPDRDGWGFEYGRTCRITGSTRYPTCSDSLIDEDDDGWGFENGFSCQFKKGKQSAVVFQQDFDDSATGVYTSAQLNAQWNTPLWHLGFNQGRVHIVSESGRGNAMRVTYPANKYGAAGATAFLSDVEFGVGLPKSYDELYVSYDVKFADGFEFVRGGKLPGLCGYDNTQLPYQGCNTGGGFPSGYDGWSARGMWREDGIMENYVYHSSQQNFYGDDEYWGVSAVPGQWHRIQHRVVLNTVGQKDGILEAWFDGEKVLSENDFVYRKTAQIGINLFYFSTFFGGNDPSWAPSTDQFVFFDNIRISTKSEF